MKIKIESVRYFQKQLLNKQEVSEKNNLEHTIKIGRVSVESQIFENNWDLSTWSPESNTIYFMVKFNFKTIKYLMLLILQSNRLNSYIYFQNKISAFVFFA